ncbi:OmpA family protein [Marinobacter sp.]|uniref:OmpA family protein n=1 Tax=Marinobacter sp. TaxID=50741 RepID=UPI0034A25239
MKKRNMTLSLAVGFSAIVAGCASTPPENQNVNEARTIYEEIRNDPDVARSGDRQLRDARDQLARAENLLEEGEETAEVDHAAYLAKRHGEIAREQGRRAELQDEINSADARRKELELEMSSSQAEQARREAELLRARMEEMQAEQTDRGMVLTLGDVLFDLNQAELKAAGEQTVSRLADFMSEYENRRVRVEGYTDSTGEASYNQRLSERRADAVRNALLDMGVSRNRVETRGYGEEYPVASNDDSSGRQQNRRVEIVISDEDGDIETRD